MKRTFATLGFVLAMAPGLAEADAPTAPVEAIDEKKVVELALRTHPTITAAAAARDAARAAASAADWARVPELRLSARYARLSSIPAEFRTFDGFTFPQLLNQVAGRASVGIGITDAFLSLAANARSAGHNAEAATLEVQTARAQIAYEARAAFLDYWSRSLAVRNAEELVKAAESNAVDQRNREKAGTVAHNDVLAFETALDAAVMSHELAKGELAGAEATLRSYLPELRDRALGVPQVSFEADQLASGSSVSDAVPPAPAFPPRLAALGAQARAAAERADAVSWQRLPNLTLYGNADMAAPNPRVFVATKLTFVPSWDVGVQLEWSLSQVTGGGARTEQARQDQAVLEARYADAKRRIDAERAGALGILNAATARAKRAHERIERAAALAKARRVESEAGTTLPLNVVLAETDLARAKNEYVEAFVMRALAHAKIDFIDGRANP